MTTKKYRSVVVWPPEVSLGRSDCKSIDQHDTLGQAEAVARGVARGGLGGEGKIFPLETWTETQYWIRNDTSPGTVEEQLVAAKAEIQNLHRQFGCELRDPNGTIWDYAAKLKIALADAIRRPMGVVPESATGLITDQEIQEAETRRPRVS